MSHDDFVANVRERVLSQEQLESIDNGETYRAIFVKTSDISGKGGEISSDIRWDDKAALQQGIANYAIAALDLHLNNSSSSKILGLGCGDGFTTKIFAERFETENALSLDPSPAIAGIARKADMQGVHGPRETVRFGEEYFDVFVMIGNLMFHHDVGFTLREVHRILKPGGIVIFELKSVNSTPHRIARWLVQIIPKIGRHAMVQRNYVNMRYGMAQSHITHIASTSLFRPLEISGKPPRLLEPKNRDRLTTGLRSIILRALEWIDRRLGELAWVQVTAVKK